MCLCPPPLYPTEPSHNPVLPLPVALGIYSDNASDGLLLCPSPLPHPPPGLRRGIHIGGHFIPRTIPNHKLFFLKEGSELSLGLWAQGP